LPGSGQVLAPAFPPPDASVFRIHHLADVVEAALPENTGRGILLRKREGTHDPHTRGAEGIGRQRFRGFGRVALATIRGLDAVRDLHDAIFSRRTFEAAAADDLIRLAPLHRVAQEPGIRTRQAAQTLDPRGRHFFTLVRAHRLDVRQRALRRV